MSMQHFVAHFCNFDCCFQIHQNYHQEGLLGECFAVYNNHVPTDTDNLTYCHTGLLLVTNVLEIPLRKQLGHCIKTWVRLASL